MSSDIHPVALELLNLNLDSIELSNALSINPLHCLSCQQYLTNPISLQCHHVFCCPCLTDRIKSGLVNCPLCGIPSTVGTGGLAVDPLLKFFLQSASEPADVCANCDQASQPMWFCETCHQPLCLKCKDETHHAKMFAAHKLVLLQERTGLGVSRNCALHGEPFILFSLESKQLVCINCFRNATLESRPHCVDLDVAYDSGRLKLEQCFKNFKGFQKDLECNIILHKTLLEEVKRNAQVECASIQQFCQQIIDKLMEIRDSMLTAVNKECTDRVEHFKTNLKQLVALIPTVQLYLLMTSIFGSAASKMDFLELGYILMNRVNSVTAESQDKRPIYTSQVQSGYKAEFAKVLDDYMGRAGMLMPNTHLQTQIVQDRVLDAVVQNGFVGDHSRSPASSVGSYQYVRNKRGSSGYATTRFSAKVDLDGAFGENFRVVDVNTKELIKKFMEIRKDAQEMQKDLTLRKCLIDEQKLIRLVERCESFKGELNDHVGLVDEVGPSLQEIWKEQLNRVKMQQEMYQSLINNTNTLKDDVCGILSIVEKFDPFIRSIKAAINTIAPRRCMQEEPAPMEKICIQINTIAPDSDLRVSAIERQAGERQKQLEEQKLKDSEIMKTSKSRLKTHKDSSRRKSGSDRTPILREVAREREMTGAHLQILQSLSASSLSGASNKGSPSHSPRSSVASSIALGGQLSPLDMSLDESLDEMVVLNSHLTAQSCRFEHSQAVAISIPQHVMLLEGTTQVGSLMNSGDVSLRSVPLDVRSVKAVSQGASSFGTDMTVKSSLSTSLPDIISTLQPVKADLDALMSDNQQPSVIKAKTQPPPPPFVPLSFDEMKLLTAKFAALPSLPKSPIRPSLQSLSATSSPEGGKKTGAKAKLQMGLMVGSGRKVDQSCIDAKERMLASLKEKVPRVEIGTSNSPERELEAKKDSLATSVA